MLIISKVNVDRDLRTSHVDIVALYFWVNGFSVDADFELNTPSFNDL